MRFSDVVGQEELGVKLRRGIREGRVPHAQLFLGQEGSGNLALALAYSQYIHCPDRTDDDSCGICSSCRKHTGMVHPDMHYSFPFPSNKADVATDLYPEWRKQIKEQPYLNYELWMQALESENKQGNIPIKECHSILKGLSLKPFEAEYKILLMWLPEFLGNEGNVLLKLIEEPPQKTVFLLVGENSDKILTTILSRVQLIRVPPLQDQALTNALIVQKGMDATDAARTSMMAAGNYLRALELAANEENRYLEPFRNWMGFCYQKKLGSAVQWADEYSGNGREHLKGFFFYSLEILRAVMVHPFMEGKSGLSSDEAEFVSKFSKIMNSHESGSKLYTWFNDAAYEIERNGNPKIILTDLSFKLARILK